MKLFPFLIHLTYFMNKNQRFPSPIDSFWSESHSLRHGVIDRNGCVWDMKNLTDSSPLHYYPFLRSYQSFQGTNLSRYFDGKSEVSHIRFTPIYQDTLTVNLKFHTSVSLIKMNC